MTHGVAGGFSPLRRVMRKDYSLYGVIVKIFDDVKFGGSLILYEDFTVEDIKERVKRLFRGKGFVVETMSLDPDRVKDVAGYDAMYFTGEVKSFADGEYHTYDTELTHVLSVEWPD